MRIKRGLLFAFCLPLILICDFGDWLVREWRTFNQVIDEKQKGKK